MSTAIQSGGYPPWVVLHVPHDSTEIPEDVRPQYLLDDVGLRREVLRMTDHETLAIFADPTSAVSVVRAPVSRLVVDVERFPDDAEEPMAGRGMGAVYSVTSDLTPMRKPVTAEEREALMRAYYRPHHARLEAAVDRALGKHGRCLVIDCHSFPDVALPFEMADPTIARPDICIGTDAFHTSATLELAFKSAFEKAGWSVSLNTPFAGALVPMSRYQRDVRVQSVMVEINRKLYLRESDASRTTDFTTVVQRIRNCCLEAIAAGI